MSPFKLVSKYLAVLESVVSHNDVKVILTITMIVCYREFVRKPKDRAK